MRLSAVLVATLAVAAPAAAGPATTATEAPACPGCSLALPAAQSDVPLLVVLPDAGEQPAHAADRYRAAALARGWAILAIPCPEQGGCAGGHWATWGGPSRYVTETLATVERTHLFDASRIFLAGTGEGATFVSANAPAWRGAFAAIVIDGAGRAPTGRAACPRGSLPAFFIGDARTADAKRLRTYYARCEQPSTSAAAGAVSTDQLLDWLDAHARPVLVSRL